MAEVGFFRRNWKMILNVATLVALIVLVVAIWDQLVETFNNIVHVKTWVLLLMIPLQVLNYDSQTRLYQHLFSIVGNRLSYKQLFRSSLELNFVNHVFPSGGVTGISYFGIRMKDAELSGAKATAVHLLKLVLLFTSFEILIVFGVFALAVQGHMNSLVLLLAASITTVLVMGSIGFWFIVGSKRRIAGFFTYVTRTLNKLIHKIRRGHPETINTDKVRVLFEDLHENYVLMSKDWRQLKWPFFWALMANIWEILTIYVVYVAFGAWVNIGAVILAYSVANFAGLVSVLPGGVGIYEGLMTLVLTATGVPSRISLPVTIMYRVLNTIIQVPPGYILYHRGINRSKPVAKLPGGEE